jgi:hypothetical protein
MVKGKHAKGKGRKGGGEVLLHRVTQRSLSALALAFIFLAAGPATAFAQIQLDGDAKKSTGTGSGTDWDEINCPNPGINCSGLTGGGGSLAKTGLIVDVPEPSFAQFTGGGSKDEQDIPNWRHRTGSPPDKDDLTNAYAAAFKRAADNHLILAFGMDRFDTSGDAQLGFWFLNQNVQPVAGGTFSGVHQDGDVLVLVNFSGGGDIPTIEVFKWLNGAPAPQGSGGAVECAGGTIPAGQSFCGITNDVSVAAPWPYVSKGVGATTQFPSGGFFEGAIDLTALGLTSCFTGFLAESRSSTSITATLKDFAIPPGFDLCSIAVDKQCVSPVLNAAQTHIIYTIRGTVTNDGVGDLHDVTLSDSPAADNNNHFDVVDCTTFTTDSGDFPVATLAAGAAVCYKATMTVPLTSNGLTDTVTVTANSEAGGTGTTVTDTAQATCPNLQVNPALTVSKDCETSVVVVNNQVVVKVTVSGQVCNTGDSNLSNVTVDDLNITTTPDPLLSGGPVLPAGQCRNYSGTYFPSTANSSNPLLVEFTDTVKATAVDIFGNAVPNPQGPPVTDPATCKLCPCPTTP